MQVASRLAISSLPLPLFDEHNHPLPSTYPTIENNVFYIPIPPNHLQNLLRTYMQSSNFPRLTVPDDIGEISAQYPITLESLRQINAIASPPIKRRRSLPKTHRTTLISMAEDTNDQPDTMAPPQAQTSFDLESFLSEDDRHFVTQMGAVSPFVSHIMKTLSGILAAIVRSNIAEGASIAEIAEIYRFHINEASHAIRNIHSAWSKYPRAGGSLEGAVIESIDYRFSATNAIKGDPESLPFRIAIFMANKIDPKDIEFQTVIHEQRRLEDCRNAMEQTYKIWQTRLGSPRHLSDDALLAELTSGSTSPITYTMHQPLPGAPTMTKPSTPAEMMSSAALAEQAEHEMHDNVHIFVGGGKVLKNQAEKRSDLAQQLEVVRKAETKEAKEAKKAKKAQETADALAASKAKGRGKKKVVVVSSSDHEDVDEQPAPKLGRKTTKTTARKRPASDIEEGDNDVDTPTKAPAARKKAKKTATKDASDDGNSEKLSGDSNDENPNAPKGTRAPENAKRGGAAPKWLRDEDNLGRQLVMDNPSWPMPRVYQEFNRQLANTAYQTDKMETHDYRADWIEFPRIDANGRSINDKAARKFDICWRTYESVRQHLEKHKARVNNPNVVKPFPWTQITENPVEHLPKRDPPPRPTYFKDGTTLVPQPEDESSAEEDAFMEDVSRSEVWSQKNESASGWTPINKTFGRTSSPMASSPAPAPEKRCQPGAKPSRDLPNASEYDQPVVFMQPETPADPGHLRSAPGDELYEDLDAFVQDQSDGEDGKEALAPNPSLIVKLPIKSRSSGAEKPKDDKESED
jgi:hypothetical protein